MVGLCSDRVCHRETARTVQGHLSVSAEAIQIAHDYFLALCLATASRLFAARTASRLTFDGMLLCRLCLRSHVAISAGPLSNLFIRHLLGLDRARGGSWLGPLAFFLCLYLPLDSVRAAEGPWRVLRPLSLSHCSVLCIHPGIHNSQQVAGKQYHLNGFFWVVEIHIPM